MLTLEHNQRPASAFRMQAALIITYLLVSFTLTWHNKRLLSTSGFKFPWLLTAIHTFVSGLGASVLVLVCGICPIKKLTWSTGWSILFAFSMLYTVNIAMSNISLWFVPLSLHQAVRSACPVFNLVIDRVALGKKYPRSVMLASVPVVLGVCIASVAEKQSGVGNVGWLGIGITVFGAVLASCKNTVTNLIMVGELKLHPIDFLFKMTPFAFVECLIVAAAVGELGSAWKWTRNADESGWKASIQWNMMLLFTNGLVAFLVNWTSFAANKETSPLTMTIVANVKQVFPILAYAFLVEGQNSALKIVGIAVTLAGGCLYSYCSWRDQESKRRALSEALLFEHDKKLSAWK